VLLLSNLSGCSISNCEMANTDRVRCHFVGVLTMCATVSSRTDGLRSVSRGEHRVPRVSKRAGKDQTQGIVVVDDEDGCTRLRGRGRHSSCALLGGVRKKIPRGALGVRVRSGAAVLAPPAPPGQAGYSLLPLDLADLEEWSFQEAFQPASAASLKFFCCLLLAEGQRANELAPS
jgi:hypothetical protein